MGRKADQLRKSLLNRELADVPERAGGEKSRGKIKPREGRLSTDSEAISFRQAVDKRLHAVNSLQTNHCKSAS